MYMRMEINVAIDDDEITIDSVVRGAIEIGAVRRGSSECKPRFAR